MDKLSDEYIGNVKTVLEDRLRPIDFNSRILNPTEKGYSVTDKEAFVAVSSCVFFSVITYGVNLFAIITDHQPLTAVPDAPSRPVKTVTDITESNL